MHTYIYWITCFLWRNEQLPKNPNQENLHSRESCFAKYIFFVCFEFNLMEFVRFTQRFDNVYFLSCCTCLIIPDMHNNIDAQYQQRCVHFWYIYYLCPQILTYFRQMFPFYIPLKTMKGNIGLKRVKWMCYVAPKYSPSISDGFLIWTRNRSQTKMKKPIRFLQIKL